MATKTTNYNLTKPSYSEDADISVINSNMDIIDSKMKEIEDKAGTGGGGSSVEWNQIQTTGSKIAEVTIDGTTTEVYAPSESGGGVDIESEVIDIRLKADGTTATSAGNAVREQITELKSDLSQLSHEIVDLQERNTLLDGIIKVDTELGYVANFTGSVNYDDKATTRARTVKGKEPVLNKGDIISLSDYSNAKMQVYYFDEDGSARYSGWITRDWECIVDGTHYIMFAYPDDSVIESALYFENLLTVKTGCSISEKVEVLETEIDYLENRISHFDYELLKGRFERGALNNETGDFLTAYKYRVSNPNIVNYDDSYLLKALEGFRIRIDTYADDGSLLNIGVWVTEHTIRKNENVKIMIARGTDNTDEIADITEFVNAIHCFSTNDFIFGIVTNDTQEVLTRFDLKYRVVKDHLVKYDTDIMLTIADGFRIHPYYYTDDFVFDGQWKGWHEKSYIIEAGKYMRFVIARVVEDTKEVVDIFEFINAISVCDINLINENNKDKDDLIRQFAKTRSRMFGDSLKNLNFVHFSDIHASTLNWNNVVSWVNKHDDILSFAIMTGDYVGANQIEHYKDLYGVCKPRKIPIFNVVGNHDTYLADNITKAQQVDTYNLLFNDCADWGVTFGNGESTMYYYKDFPTSNIRLIVLDQYYDIDNQREWLVSILNGAKEKGYSVITASHTQTNRIVTKESTFNSLDDYSTIHNIDSEVNGFEDLIKTFKDNGGTHICHLCGHWHHDEFGYTELGILNIVVECAISDEQHTNTKRENGTRTYDCLNAVSINPVNHTISIVRIGVNTDNYMQSKNVLCYDYMDKKILSNY